MVSEEMAAGCVRQSARARREYAADSLHANYSQQNFVAAFP